MFVPNIQRVLNTADEGARAWLLEELDAGRVNAYEA